MKENLTRDWIDRARLTDIEDVAHRYSPQLKRFGGDLTGPCPVCGGHDRFVVSPHKRIFRCRKCDVSGDVIALVAHAEGLDLSGRDFLRAVEIVSGEPPPNVNAAPDPEREARLAEQRARIETERAAREQAERDREMRHRTFAMRIWQESEPATGTAVERYLQARAIKLPPPPTLRFHRGLSHSPSGSAWPAMVALVTRDRAMLGVHRTWLAKDGSGKAPVEYNKMALGPVGSGAVRLGPVAAKIAVTEGIETGLSVMKATGIPTWATLGTSGMVALVLPPEVREVVICADRDTEGDGERAANDAAQRWLAEGRLVRLALPPPGYKDFNDMAAEMAAEGTP